MSDSIQLAPVHPYFEVDNPKHFINLIPECIRHAAYQIPYDWFEWDEATIIVKTYGDQPNDVDTVYRLNFWETYNEKFEQEKSITLKDITGNSGTGYLHKSILTNPGRTLYLITEPTKSKSQTRFTHHLAMKTMIETLKMPILYNSKTGLPDTQLIAIKQKIFEYVDQRMHGSIIQKQQIQTTSTNQNLNINVDATKSMEAIPHSLEEVERRIKEIEREIANAPAPPALSSFQEILPVEESMQNVKTVLPQSIGIKND